MQNLKGLIALLIVALVIFAFCARNDMKSQDAYAKKMKNPEAAYMAALANHNANKASTHLIHQAKHTAKNVNL